MKVPLFPFLVCLLLLSFFPFEARAQDGLEQIKAVFLFKFGDYVSWPDRMDLDDGDVFSLCVWGKHPFGRTLDVLARKDHRYKYEISYISHARDVSSCHMVFTRNSVSALPENTAFLVSDRSGFVKQGGMVEMRQMDGKIKLVSNLKRVEKAGYKISSRLLNIMDVLR